MRKPIKNLLARKTVLFVAIAYSIVVTALLLTPIPEQSSVDVPNLDKLVHVFIYMLLVLLWLWAKVSKFSGKQQKTWWVISFVLIYGIVIEIIQGNFIPTRSFDFFDILANTGGILLGYWIFRTGFFQNRILK